MRETFSDNFKKIFLLKFTKELILHAEELEFSRLQEIIKSKEKKKIRLLKKRPEEEITPVRIVIKKPEAKKQKIPVPQKEIMKKPPVIPPAKSAVQIMPARQPQLRPARQPALIVPEPKLPEHLEYLRPIPKAGINIDLGKINPLINDPAVKIIEASPGENVTVTGAMGTKPTGIILSKEEISEIIFRFSEASKIPVEEGIYRVAVGNLSLSAVVSEEIGSKFIIKKITAPPVLQPIPQRYPPSQIFPGTIPRRR